MNADRVVGRLHGSVSISLPESPSPRRTRPSEPSTARRHGCTHEICEPEAARGWCPSIRPEGLFERGEEPGRRELSKCGDAILLLEGQVRRVLQEVCCSRTRLRLCRCVVLEPNDDPGARQLMCSPVMAHKLAWQSARIRNAWLRAWLCES